MVSYVNFLIFFCLALLFAVGTLILSKLVRYFDPSVNPVKVAPYECGEDPVGDARIRFPVSFYLIALIFVLFDVEAAFLFPWILSLSKLGLLAFTEMLIFLSILFLGWFYAFKKGDLKWERQ
ncbi:MAG TPA: NADH-quinone oxidoreductase subunit A [Thermodesulfobacteriota bacterium]